MNNDPVRIGRISARVEKALGHDFGENIFCYITEAQLREFSTRWPEGYLKKVEEASRIMKEPQYVGIDEKSGLLYYVKEYLIGNSHFKRVKSSKRYH